MDKKGFTLIELLAVIIILAILMIIAVPNILNTLATARSEAFLSQAKSIYKSAEQQYVLDSMSGLANTCYDKSNLDMGSISDTVSFVVSVDEEDGTVNNIEIIDTGQQFKASGKEINSITMKTYTEGTVSCSGYTTPYTETLLNGADPVLGEGMIPVKLSSTGSSWTVTKADTTKRWYKYGKSEWANAVILKSSDTTTYNAGDIIPNANIEAYFVWIPKYKYKLFNLGNYTSTTSKYYPLSNQLIEIQFGTDTTVDSETSCASPMESGASGNCAIGEWMSHPSFLSFNKNGFWVGKFETTGEVSTSTENDIVTTTISSISVLPGLTPLNSMTVFDMFSKSYNYRRVLDSHMMKNTEWGAVAYLSNSKYGIGNTVVWINNNSNSETGCVSSFATENEVDYCGNKWFSSLGSNGSTSGNITGIYDMGGGIIEYLIAYISNANEEIDLFLANYDNKYYDLYDSATGRNKYNYRILGDAIGEIGPIRYSGGYFSSWYEQNAIFIETAYPILTRGGKFSSGSKAGLFNFSRSTGYGYADRGFRLVLAP